MIYLMCSFEEIRVIKKSRIPRLVSGFNNFYGAKNAYAGGGYPNKSVLKYWFGHFFTLKSLQLFDIL